VIKIKIPFSKNTKKNKYDGEDIHDEIKESGGEKMGNNHMVSDIVKDLTMEIKEEIIKEVKQELMSEIKTKLKKEIKEVIEKEIKEEIMKEL